MISSKSVTTVQGQEFITWCDYIARGTFAENATTHEVKQIKGSGYISNDLTMRKAIASAFGLSSFRK